MKSLPSLLTSALALSTTSQSSIVPTRFPNVTWDNTAWTLRTTTFTPNTYQSRMSLSNGYIGINAAAIGPFFDIDVPVNGDQIGGWPLFERRQSFATIAGFYDSQPTTKGTNFEWLNQYDGESVISGIPHWGGLTVTYGEHVLDAKVPVTQIQNFTSSLDMKGGVLEWEYVWEPVEGRRLRVRYTMLVHKLRINLGVVRLELTADEDAEVVVTDVLDGECAVRTDFVRKSTNKDGGIATAVRPWGIEDVEAHVFSTLRIDTDNTDSPILGNINGNKSTIAQAKLVHLKAGHTTKVEKFVGIASRDTFPNPEQTAREAAVSAAAEGFDRLLETHETEWRTTTPDDSVDSYLVDGALPNDPNVLQLHILAVTNVFQLLQNTISPRAISPAGDHQDLDIHSMGVCGLGSSCYAGHIFWDADVWIAPGLIVSHPEAAKQIAKYRVAKFQQAKANMKTAFQSSKNETGRFTDSSAAVYPWTSGRYGNCTGTGPCFDYEYHLNGDIAMNLYNYYITTGDSAYFKSDLFTIYEAIAALYSEILTLNTTTGLYSLHNATDPDEFANHINKPAFTTALIETHLNYTNMLRQRFNIPPSTLYTQQATHLDFPTSSSANIILEYDSMPGSISVKQADVVLIDGFLDYPNPYALSNLDYYAGKQSRDGPAMTYSVFAEVANYISPSGCSAHTYEIGGTEPYLRAPWFQFSEQLVDDYSVNGGFHPAFPFLTGAGGANRVAIFGYLGLRLHPDHLNVNPNLPPQIETLRYRTFYWNGHAISTTSNRTHTTLSRLPVASSLGTADSRFRSESIPVSVGRDHTPVYELSFDAPVVIPNRRIGEINTWSNNLCQCRPIAAASPNYIPGQIPLAAIDGAISTKWRPLLSSEPSYLTVDIGYDRMAKKGNSIFPVRHLRFDWGQSPPETFQVIFSNTTLPPFTDTDQALTKNATGVEKVEISHPYNPATAHEVVPYVGNQTNVTLPETIWSGRYAMLIIEGNQDERENGEGATVAEFAVIAEGEL